MAVLAAMYGRNAAADSSTPLTDVQLVHKIILADMLQVGAASSDDDVAKQACSELCDSVVAAEGMSQDCQELLLRLRSWPDCLLACFESLTRREPICVLAEMWVAATELRSGVPLHTVRNTQHAGFVEEHLVAAFGDLHDVWEDAELQLHKKLMQLPLPAMQLLLSSHDLTVPNEDIVWYTTSVYVNGRPEGEREYASKLLAPLVRCPHLSSAHIVYVLAMEQPEEHMLFPFLKHLRMLAMLRQVQPDHTKHTPAALKELLKDAPPSWLRGPRKFTRPVVSVKTSWAVAIRELRECLNSVARAEGSVHLPHTSPPTAPLNGVPFALGLFAKATPGGGAVLGVTVRPGNRAGITVAYKYRLRVADVRMPSSTVVWANGARHRYHYHKVFETAAPGWNQGDWIAAGLPLDDLGFELEVFPA